MQCHSQPSSLWVSHLGKQESYLRVASKAKLLVQGDDLGISIEGDGRDASIYQAPQQPLHQGTAKAYTLPCWVYLKVPMNHSAGHVIATDELSEHVATWSKVQL